MITVEYDDTHFLENLRRDTLAGLTLHDTNGVHANGKVILLYRIGYILTCLGMYPHYNDNTQRSKYLA